MNLSAITLFDENFKQLIMKSITEVEKFEPEPTFEKNISNIKANHLKIITSIDMNASTITSNKHSSSSEHIKSDLMPWILLQSPGNHHSSPIIFLQCTLKEKPNSKFENGGLLLDQHYIYHFFGKIYVNTSQ